MNKVLENKVIFVCSYIIFMGLNYFLSNAGSTSVVVQGFDDFTVAGSSISLLPILLNVSAILVLLWISFERGVIIGKKWIVLLPAVAFAFELIPALSAIPMVPLVYHLLAIVIGATCPIISALDESTQ
jgi:hypothetical protein